MRLGTCYGIHACFSEHEPTPQTIPPPPTARPPPPSRAPPATDHSPGRVHRLITMAEDIAVDTGLLLSRLTALYKHFTVRFEYVLNITHNPNTPSSEGAPPLFGPPHLCSQVAVFACIPSPSLAIAEECRVVWQRERIPIRTWKACGSRRGRSLRSEPSSECHNETTGGDLVVVCGVFFDPICCSRQHVPARVSAL